MGIVQLSATIGTDGSVQSVSVLSGPPELVDAAVDAVKQWVYQPTMLNGNPVQVTTTIDINFTLSQ
jgi:protein TonB